MMFKALFHKFIQHQSLTTKLLGTEKDGLYEATTDKFFGCGIGFHSKRWESKSWDGKNVTGTLLTKVRRVLRKKGLQLDKLVFNYSLASVRSDLTSKQRELFLGEPSVDPSRKEVENGHERSLASIRTSRVTQEDRVDKEIGELSALIEQLESETKHTKQSIIRSWAAKETIAQLHQSH